MPLDGGVIFGGSGRQLGVQLLGITVVLLWAAVIVTPAVFALRALGLLLVPRDAQLSAHVRSSIVSHLRNVAGSIEHAADAVTVLLPAA